MPRLWIDLDAEAHDRLKVLAEQQGQSVEDFVVSRALAAPSDRQAMVEADALAALQRLLAPRLRDVEAGRFSVVTSDDIKSEARRRAREG